MNRPILAAIALAAGLALAAPMLATAADSDQPSTQAVPGNPGHPGMPGMMRHMMTHQMAQLSPRQRCDERLARRAGVVAYTVAKLNLTAEQRPLWDKLQAQMQAAGDRHRQLCAALPTTADGGQQTILDRLGRQEQFLAARLQAIQQIRPALQQFYQALTPAQQSILNHPFRPA